jgi:hypothetical protein
LEVESMEFVSKRGTRRSHRAEHCEAKEGFWVLGARRWQEPELQKGALGGWFTALIGKRRPDYFSSGVPAQY